MNGHAWQKYFFLTKWKDLVDHVFANNFRLSHENIFFFFLHFKSPEISRVQKYRLAEKREIAAYCVLVSAHGSSTLMSVVWEIWPIVLKQLSKIIYFCASIHRHIFNVSARRILHCFSLFLVFSSAKLILILRKRAHSERRDTYIYISLCLYVNTRFNRSNLKPVILKLIAFSSLGRTRLVMCTF